MITLKLIDTTGTQPVVYSSIIPLPAIALSVLVGARIAYQRACEKSFNGQLQHVTVRLGDREINQNEASRTYIPDNTTLTVKNEAGDLSDVWILDL